MPCSRLGTLVSCLAQFFTLHFSSSLINGAFTVCSIHGEFLGFYSVLCSEWQVLCSAICLAFLLDTTSKRYFQRLGLPSRILLNTNMHFIYWLMQNCFFSAQCNNNRQIMMVGSILTQRTTNIIRNQASHIYCTCNTTTNANYPKNSK